MKKNLIMKAIASMTAVLTVSAMAIPGLSAFAAGSGTTLTEAQKNVEFTIDKDIVLFNVDANTQIYEPNVTYSYAVSEVTVTSATITDTDSNVVQVRSGIPNAVTIKGNGTEAAYGAGADLVFGADNKKDTNMEGTEVTQDAKRATEKLGIKINADVIYGAGETHNPPGVYRYKLSDTTTDDMLEKAGIQRDSDYKDDIYLDVYTRLAAGGGLEVYGYTLFKSSSSTDAANQSITEDNTTKVTGYDVNSETKTITEDKVEIISDQYHTYNVEIKKTVAGTLGDTNNEFPFQIALTNGTVKSEADFYWTQSGGSEQKTALETNGSQTLGALSDSSEIKLKDGDTCTIYGLPVDTKVLVSENNNTGSKYSVEAKQNNVTIELNADKAAGSASVAMKAAGNVNKTSGKDEIEFINTLNDVSVTGLFFSIAPFAFIMAAGVVLMGLLMKNKKRGENESRI